MKIKKIVPFLVLGAGLSCSSKKVTRIKASQIVDISGRFNDSDAQITASAISEEILSQAWLLEFCSNNQGKKPTVVIGGFQNKSSEHIDPDTFIVSIEKEMINSRKVNLVANETLRSKVRIEKNDQQIFASEETRAKIKKELGADYIMFGAISSIQDANEDDKVVYYQISFRLVDLETNQVVWIGDKKIKKYNSKSKKVRSQQRGELPE